MKGLVLCCAVFAAVSFYRAPPSSPVPRSSSNLAVRAERRLQTIGIQDVRLGDRLAGHNPIREQAENVEPDPATWRAISLRMTKESGNGLWIELLRPVEWIERHEAEPGVPVYLELHEMGAVGDAEVTDIGPCPTIQPGDGGAVVTGTFKHEADENTDVVHLKLEGQIELTGVTDNHAYWSADRRDFVEVGKLRVGELVDTEYGERRIVSVTPIDYTGYLYNLETTEYVYRVGSAGTLVHNKCAPNRKYDGPEHHIASNKDKVFKPLFQKLFQKAGLSLNSPWNRMRLRGHVGPHGKYYNDLVYRRLRDAVGSRTGAAAERALIAELKAIRRDIRHNGWDALLKSRASGVDVRGEF